MDENHFIIPVDDAIKRFYEHLNAHERTILSAKFGDGKTYFLQKFMEDEKVKEGYTFLTLYPVNYQVAENRDIFELIKYDLLIQMFAQNILSPEFKLTKAQALAWCLQLHASSIAEGLLPIISELCLDEKNVKVVSTILTGKKLLGKVKQKVTDLEESVRDKQIEQFLKEMRKNPISGQDVITGIIQQGITEYKKANQDKEIVLVIEDMDRMDPAHLFRILNVFSAHIDYNYRFGPNPCLPYIGNKFGLDKVVFVMNYDCTESIFRHFYGLEADYKGYINKFCSSNYFTYSFDQQKEEYYYKRIIENTKIDPYTIKLFIRPEDLSQHTIREVVNAIEELDDFVLVGLADETYYGKTIVLHDGVLRVIAILRKLGMSNDDIKNRLMACMEEKEQYKVVISYMAGFLTYIKGGNYKGRVHYRYSHGNQPSIFEINSFDHYGRADCLFFVDNTNERKDTKEISQILDKLLEMVAS
jgi:hypothetical protein